MDASKTAVLPFAYNMVDGLITPLEVTQRKVDEVKAKLRLRQGDVVVDTYPKSGTTWVQQILKLLKNGGKEDGMIVEAAVPWLEFELPPESPFQWDVESLPTPAYIKSHMPYSSTLGCLPHTTLAKYIYVIRNPKDVAVSYFHHYRGFKFLTEFSGSWDEFFKLYLAGNVYFGSWFDHVLGWWKHKDAENVLFVKYEDLKRNLRKEVQKIADFVLADIPPASVIDVVAQQCTFDGMKENPVANFVWLNHIRNSDEPPFMRKGEVGDWRNYFTAEQNATFDALYAERMKDSGLDIEFD